MGRRLRWAGAGVAAVVLTGFAVQSAGAAPAEPVSRQQAFAAAAAEFGVPRPVLMAVAYNLSRFEQHGGAPSTTGAYGVMGLTDVPASAARGTGGPAPGSASLHTLNTAARLAGASSAATKSDDATNIRAGAALLAQYARDVDHGALPDSIGGWYGAVEKYAQTPDATAAGQFAGDVFSTIRTGASERTDGGPVTLAATPSARPDTASAAGLHLARPAAGPAPECPPELSCDFVP
ncbi:MAG TPA: hypothetical protein VHC49_20590, partial [Mycobacteriales bacterium]|nr:hypothetical protein [Mycobacteriales bacterium]